MRCIYLLSLFCCVHYSTSQLASLTWRQHKTPCESSGRNSLVEHFFNIIFTEFFNTPPVCVCVQMCAGQSTYCYPNGCLKSAMAVHEGTENSEKMPATPPPQIHKNKNQFMLVKNEKNDFMSEFLERNYGDVSVTPKQNINNPGHAQELRPDPFKDKYSMFGKYKRVPKVELRYTIKEKVKNTKIDMGKIEGVDLTKTRWPMNKQHRGSGHKLFADIEKPLLGKANFFTAMLPENEVAEYPPKYFKRDLTKTVDDDDRNLKAFYVLDSLVTENKSLSLETLIDNLIRSNFITNLDETTANSAMAKSDEIVIGTKTTIEKVVNVNSTAFANDTTRVISMNFTNENVDKNKYVDYTSPLNKTNDLNEMITYLSKEIEKQNNTSMEIAKRIVADFDNTTLNSNYENVTNDNDFTTVSIEPEITHGSTLATVELQTETTTQQEIKVTKKNRQRIVKKLASTKTN